MLKIVKCVIIIGNISRSACDKLLNVKRKWSNGYKTRAAVDGIITMANVTCTAIVLYDPWILVRPLLIVIPYVVQHIPLVSIKTILIYGLEFVEI